MARPVMPGSKRKPHRSPGGQAKRAKRSLDALAIASSQFSDEPKLLKERAGQLEARSTPFAAKRQAPADDEIEHGSDSEGNTWQVGEVDSQDDSELDSDLALGESDEERFEGFTFRGSSSKKSGGTHAGLRKQPSISSGEGNEERQVEADEEASWSGFESDTSDVNGLHPVADPHAVRKITDGTLDGEHSDGMLAPASTRAMNVEDDEDDVWSGTDDEHDPTHSRKLSALQKLIHSMNPEPAGGQKKPHRSYSALEGSLPSDFGVNSARKLTIDDLLPSLTDPALRKSLRLISSTRKAKSSARSNGIPEKLEPPLAKRQQDRLDRAAAYQKSKETLERWIDTIKYNRRADHLIFPLTDPKASLLNRPAPLLPSAVTNLPDQLDSTIQKILLESGLAPTGTGTEEKNIQLLEEEEQLKEQSVAEAQARRAELRMARELLFREELRAKRLKRIKSKTFRRIHRKEREKIQEKTRAALAEGGLLDLDEEKELNDRKRAEARMGARHRESRWAKEARTGGRAKWDEEVRFGMAEMARREEILKKRIEGKPATEGPESGGSDTSSDDGSDSESEQTEARGSKLLRKLENIEGHHSHGQPATGASKLSSMKFMQRAEAAKKAENDAMVKEIQRELAGEEAPSDDEPSVIGRRKLGPSSGGHSHPTGATAGNPDDLEDDADSDDLTSVTLLVRSRPADKLRKPKEDQPDTEKPRPKERLLNSKSKLLHGAARAGKSGTDDNAHTPNEVSMTVTQPKEGKGSRTKVLKPAPQAKGPVPRVSKVQGDTGAWTSLAVLDAESASDDEDAAAEGGSGQKTAQKAPLSQQELRRRAFAGDEVEKSFVAEKEHAIAEEGEKVVDNTLPGWGSWVGEGIDKRRQNNRKDKFVTKIDGVKRENRADAKLPSVIMSERRIKKNTKYLASAIPYPFENQQQYERSLRLPIGPEWTTKETFQDATKPRIIIKQGVIGPMENPFL